MSRPTTDPAAPPVLRGPARRDRYLEVARRLFEHEGYVGTSTDKIVAAAGGSKATLYRHFPRKEDLVAGLIADIADRARPHDDIFGEGDTPLRAALEQIGHVAFDAVLGEHAVADLRLALSEHHRFPEFTQTLWQLGPASIYRKFRTFLRHRHARGELDVPDPQLAAEQFIAGLVGYLQLKIAMGATVRPGEHALERRVQSGVDTFLARYGVAGSGGGS